MPCSPQTCSSPPAGIFFGVGLLVGVVIGAFALGLPLAASCENERDRRWKIRVRENGSELQSAYRQEYAIENTLKSLEKP